MSANVAGWVDDSGHRHIYTSALSDEATFTLELLRMIHATRVTRGTPGDVEACGRCEDNLMVPEAQGGGAEKNRLAHTQIVLEFFSSFAGQFKRQFNECPESVWRPLYRKGISELHDLGIAEQLEKDGEGNYAARRVWFNRVHVGAVELKEG